MTTATLARPRRDPLTGDAYALLGGTITGGVLGAAYWVAAAHLLSAHRLGVDAGLLATATLVASVAGLNLPGALAYVVPRLGRRAVPQVRRAYALTAALSVAVAGVALVVAHAVGRTPAASTPLGVAAFAVATVVLAFFTLQDGVLLGLGRARWVVPESAAFGVAKLVLLPFLVWWGSGHAVVVSWVVPAGVLVLLISGRLVWRELHAAPDLEPERLQLRGFVGLNAVGSLLYQASVALLPLLVLAARGPAAGAVFYVAWTWSCALDLGTHALGASLTTQTSARPAEASGLARRLARRTVVLVSAAAAGLLLLSGPLLHVYGPTYDGAVPALRLLVLASLPRVVVILAQSAARGAGQAALGVWTELLLCSVSLGLGAAVVGGHGGTGVAAAWLVANTAGAFAVWPAWRRLTGRAR